MQTIDLNTIKTLRNKTGVSLFKCKKALEESGGDLNQAEKLLFNKTTKETSDSVLKNGKITVYNHSDRIGAMVEIRCETDFAANTHEFKYFCDLILVQIVGANPKYLTKDNVSEPDMEKKAAQIRQSGITEAEDFDAAFEEWYGDICLMSQKHVNPFVDKTIAELKNELSVRLGEAVEIKRFVRWEI